MVLLVVVVGATSVKWYVRHRTSNGEDAPTLEVASVKPTIPVGKSAKVRCHHCQHVQTVPVSLPTFECEQCKAKLKRNVGSVEHT